MLTCHMFRHLTNDHGKQLRQEADSERLAHSLAAPWLRVRRHRLALRRRRITNPHAAPSGA